MKEDVSRRREAGVRKRCRQVHIWFTIREYQWLKAEAEASDETISAVVRRLLQIQSRLHKK